MQNQPTVIETPADVTVGELGRRLERFENTVTGALSGISGKLDDRPDWVDVRKIEAALKEAIDRERAAAEVRLKRIEDFHTWIIRIVLGIVIAAVLAGVVVSKSPL